MDEEVARFLYREAELLDGWQLEAWLGLFDASGAYFVHDSSIGIDASPDDTLFYIADDYVRLAGRVERLRKRTAIAEFPASRTRHFVTNVQAGEQADGVLAVTANQLVYRWRERTDLFFGRLSYRLCRDGEGFRIIEKRYALDSGDLREQGRVSIIL